MCVCVCVCACVCVHAFVYMPKAMSCSHKLFTEAPKRPGVKNNRETGERGSMRGRLQVEEGGGKEYNL